MTTQPTHTKTIRVPADLHDAALQHKRPGESFTAYVNRLIAEDVSSREIAIDMETAYMKLEAERDFYKKAWERRGKALALPCLQCGYVQNTITTKEE